MNWDNAITFFVLFMILFIVYSRIRDRSLRETWNEIVELFSPREVIE